MKLSIDLKCNSSQEWLDAVMLNFPAFLQDHANCERKASSMVMSLVAKYPNRIEIIPELIATAVEELEHFQQVYQVMEKMGILLPHEIGKDEYAVQLVNLCRSDVENRFMDRLLLASVMECRGAERFRLVAEALPEGELKQFYKRLWTSEAKHGHIFVGFALNYFTKEEVYTRLEELMTAETTIINNMPIKAALH
jgi:tRNA-(ms[2]io[6]A)-hydroxylase